MESITQIQFREEDNAALARLFSPSIFRELASKGRSAALARLASQSLLIHKQAGTSIGDFFEHAFHALKKEKNRSEYVYKTILAQKTVLGVHNLNTATLLSEFRAGSSKADVVVVNGTTTVYEVKSERDKLERLPGQISDYLKVFGRVNVVVAEKHLKNAEQILPASVGILRLTKRAQISTVRKAADNISNLVSSAIFQSLSVKEASEIAAALGREIPDVPNTQLYAELNQIFKGLPADLVHQALVEVIRKTRSQRSLRDFVESLPPSLRANALTTPLKVNDRLRMLGVLGMPLKTIEKWI